jgi:hypothetical protein
MAHGIKRGKFELGRHQVQVIVASIVALTLVAFLYLTLVSSTAAQGRHVQELRAELLRLRMENEQLEIAVAKAGSVFRLAERAREMGFAPPEHVEYLQVDR